MNQATFFQYKRWLFWAISALIFIIGLGIQLDLQKMLEQNYLRRSGDGFIVYDLQGKK